MKNKIILQNGSDATTSINIKIDCDIDLHNDYICNRILFNGNNLFLFFASISHSKKIECLKIILKCTKIISFDSNFCNDSNGNFFVNEKLDLSLFERDYNGLIYIALVNYDNNRFLNLTLECPIIEIEL